MTRITLFPYETVSHKQKSNKIQDDGETELLRQHFQEKGGLLVHRL